ncbi:MAG: hypothetical protein IPM82_08935 [Saprospiraceae bacterium]|nr:hypothetical protein [Saprospiraceae bacterium]
MIKYYSINGELVPKAQASLGVTDLAIQRGYGLFDYFVVKKASPSSSMITSTGWSNRQSGCT